MFPRVRCGFGTGWEDHWICEYWDITAGTWRIGDSQIDDMLRRRNRIEFDPADVPRQFFLTAGEAWLKCRHAEADPDAFGHGDVKGVVVLEGQPVARPLCAARPSHFRLGSLA